MAKILGAALVTPLPKTHKIEGEPASINLLDKEDKGDPDNGIPGVETDMYIDVYSNNGKGETTSCEGAKTSGFIPVENGETYIFPASFRLYTSTSEYSKSVHVYDSERKYLGHIVGESWADDKWIVKVTINKENAAYIRVSMNVYPKYDTDIHIWDNMMVIKGDYEDYPDPITDYRPFKESTVTPVLAIDLREEYIQSFINPLYRKTIIFAGDSICKGKHYGDNNDGWAGRIAARNQMTYKNYAIAGATIAEEVAKKNYPDVFVSSISRMVSGFEYEHQKDVNGKVITDIDGDPYIAKDADGKPIFTTKETGMIKDYPNADYIIFEGGCNDADMLGSHLSDIPDKFGAFTYDDKSDDYVKNLDKTTFCGALESIFYRAKKQWKGKKIGYIVAPKMVNTTYSGTGFVAETNNRRNYFETAIQICRKWNIPVLNLWDFCYLDPTLSSMFIYKKEWDEYNGPDIWDGTSKVWKENEKMGKMYADGQHLLSAGYDYIADIINNWLKTL